HDRPSFPTRRSSGVIDEVPEAAWPDPATADELHDALMLRGLLPAAGGRGAGPVTRADWMPHFEVLKQARRATRLVLDSGRAFWVAAEQLPLAIAVHARARLEPQLEVPAGHRDRVADRGEAVRELLRGRLQATGPVTAAALAAALAVDVADVDA